MRKYAAVIRRLPGALALTLLLLVGCESDNPALLLPERTPLASPISRDARVIGLVGTMSGPGSWRGEDAFEGADLAVTLLNRRLRSGQPSYQLVTLDDEGDPRRAIELVRQLAESTQTVGVVYAGPPAALPAAEPALAEAGIPAILCIGDLYGARRLTPHVFQVSPSFRWEARRIAAYLLRDRGYSRLGLLRERSLMGDVATDALRQALIALDAERPTPYEFAYRHDDPKLATALSAFRARRVEALVVEGGPAFFGRVAKKLRSMGARYRGTAAAQAFAAAEPNSHWAPQLVGFDLAINQVAGTLPRGTVAADSYARGAHYLPIPSFESFRAAFKDWWAEEPLGWEQRSFDAANLVGWAASRAKEGEDRAVVLEGMENLRFGGLDVTFGPDDHTAVHETSVGLWVVPSRAARVRERALLSKELPWVPLARGFSIDGRRTIVAAEDWRYLFVDPPPKNAPAPRVTRARWGVATPRSDPVH
ncbi:MAG TPA: ABC transporter substrate-binding protein [Actinomycetota bacterium]|nr:ABC transporter substrate-binding protein [Actinomycetota bacterium]